MLRWSEMRRRGWRCILPGTSGSGPGFFGQSGYRLDCPGRWSGVLMLGTALGRRQDRGSYAAPIRKNGELRSTGYEIILYEKNPRLCLGISISIGRVVV